jgi:hypothetical protein
MNEDLSPRPRTRDDVVFRRLGEEFAILDPEGQVVHVLNPTAAAVWVLCDGTLQLDGIAREVARVFDVSDPDRVRADVTGAIATFVELGLLQ